ncbi:TPA: hypothetical protein [Aquificae Joseph's Coat Spring virus]|nr:TPA: hypothetical protein [Aquificae Joseph's Coat Spring virus]
MANKNVSVLLGLETYIQLIQRKIRTSDLKLALQPVESFEGVLPLSDRAVIYKEVSMPEWWGDWYKTLDRSARLKFAAVIQDRLNQMLGGAA